MANRHTYDLDKLLTFGSPTDRQKEVIKTLRECGTLAATGKKLGVGRRNIQEILVRVSKRAIAGDIDTSIPEGMFVKGWSGYRKTNEETGEQTITGEWIKAEKSKVEQLSMFEKVIKSIADNVDGMACKIATPVSPRTDNTLTVYNIGDAHIGLLAWGKETGEDHDLEVAEKDLLGAMDLLVEQSLDSSDALIVDVGDWFHSDNSNNTTAHSGNHLDVDGRYPKVLEIGLMLAIKLIEKALHKHDNVEWRSAIGNHNEHSATMMSSFIKAWYRNEPRVKVADTPSMFYYKQFGKNLIGITHGHTVKADKLGEVMSVDCESIWSESKFRYWYTGHVHHQSVKEFTSCIVETFGTLAGKDAWHNASGYRSKQEMKSITLHKDYGEITRNTVSLNMVRMKRINNDK